MKNVWRLHSILPERVWGSSAVVLNDIIYNIGGNGSSHSVMWSRANPSSKWYLRDLSNYNFSGYYLREAFVLENKIVYFGVVRKKATLFWRKKKGQSSSE